MIIGNRLNHKTFGIGEVIDFTANASDEIKSTLTIKFNDGSIKKFALSFLDKMFSDVPSDLIEYVNRVRSESETKHKAYLDKFDAKKPQRDLNVHYFNEYKREVTEEDWEKAYAVAGTYRFSYESRPVVADNILYINATAACVELGADHRAAYSAYKACERGEKFLGVRWSYATKADIMNNYFNKKEED